MASSIRQLSDRVANQIAAGEVIERPANVVKELVENAIDAGATRITVTIEDGGRRLVEVSDDGHGMDGDELPLALARHATSKLRDADDLFAVATLGFRGEALPSIAGVSEFELASRRPGSDGGSRLVVHGSEQRAHEACAMAPGTRVCVRNLFWNVPVRLKFLKTQATETGHVTDMLTRLALGHPGVGFALVNDGKTTLELPAVRELTPRIRACFGRKLAAGLLAVDGHAEGVQLTGLAAHPSHARPTGKRQFVFLNGRHIRDKLLVAAIREGYRGYLEPRLHPVAFLHLDMDPSLVDVNVHPTKSEVRFRRDKEVFHLVRSALREALQREIGGFTLTGPAERRAETPQPQRLAPGPAIQERYLPRETPVEPALDPQARPTTTSDHRPHSETPASATSDHATSHQPRAAESRAAYDDALPPGVRRILQLHDMYLLLETDDGIRLIDQHALHEKALYLCLDPATTDLAAGGRQELLIPRTVELSAAQVAALEPQLEDLARCGIAAELFGPTTILLRGTPAALARLDWTAFFEDLAELGPGPDAIERLRERIAHRRACRAAVKAGDRLGEAEQRELVRLLYTLEDMEHCPHGRPTTLDLGWDELEKRFQR